jgi:hypothetical protein
VLISHFGEWYWIETTVKIWASLNLDIVILIAIPLAEYNTEIVKRLVGLGERLGINLKTVPVKTHEVNHASFNHMAAIATLREMLGYFEETTHVVLADSDLWPVERQKFRKVLCSLDKDSGFLAVDPKSSSDTHPCFMVFPVEDFQNLDLALGMENFVNDFGRRFGDYLVEGSAKSYTILTTLKFPNRDWDFYPSAGILHFGSQSFVNSPWSKLSMIPSRRSRSFMTMLASYGILARLAHGSFRQEESLGRASFNDRFLSFLLSLLSRRCRASFLGWFVDRKLRINEFSSDFFKTKTQHT